MHPTSSWPTQDLDVNDDYTRMQCTHYVTSLYGKLSNEMTGKFNQDLPGNLQAAFEKATNFEPRIITKQNINGQKVNEVNQINVSWCENEIEVNEAHHVRNPNYKGKNYDPNFQQNKNKTDYNSNPSNQANNYKHNRSQRDNNNWSSTQDKPTKVAVMLNGPVSREQLFKIQEVLRHPSQYRDKLKPEDRSATGEYTKSFNKFCPKKVEVSEATVDEVVSFGHSMKKSDDNIAEAINIYKALGDEPFYRPEEQPNADPQKDQMQ